MSKFAKKSKISTTHPYMIIVADAADIVSGATLLHMTNNFAPHYKIVCNVELLVIAPHDKFTMYSLLS